MAEAKPEAASPWWKQVAEMDGASKTPNWVWVKISHQESDCRFECPCFHLPGQAILGFPYF